MRLIKTSNLATGSSPALNFNVLTNRGLKILKFHCINRVSGYLTPNLTLKVVWETTGKTASAEVVHGSELDETQGVSSVLPSVGEVTMQRVTNGTRSCVK